MRTVILLALCLVSCSTVEKSPKIISCKVTAYHSKEKDHLKYKNFDATGHVLKKNYSIAADWSLFPVGTKLKFNDFVYEVSDYGSSLINKPIPVIDLYVSNKNEMEKWGARFMNLEVVEWGSFEKSAEILKDRLKYSHCMLMYKRIQTKL